MRCGALVSRSENGSIFKVDAPADSLAKFTAAETLAVTARLGHHQQPALARAAARQQVQCEFVCDGAVLRQHGPRRGKRVFDAIVKRAGVVPTSETYDANLQPPTPSCTRYRIRHTPVMAVRNGIVIMPDCGQALSRMVLPATPSVCAAVTSTLLEHCLSALTDNAEPFVNVDIRPDVVVLLDGIATVVGTDNLPLLGADPIQIGRIQVPGLSSNPCATMLAQAALTAAVCHGDVPLADVESVREVPIAPGWAPVVGALRPDMELAEAVACLNLALAYLRG